MEKRSEITIGTKYGTLTILKELPDDLLGHRMVQVECVCGTIKKVQLSNLMAGFSHTCGKTQCREIMRGLLDQQIRELKERISEKAAKDQAPYRELYDKIKTHERELIEKVYSNQNFTIKMNNMFHQTRLYLDLKP